MNDQLRMEEREREREENRELARDRFVSRFDFLEHYLPSANEKNPTRTEIMNEFCLRPCSNWIESGKS